MTKIKQAEEMNAERTENDNSWRLERIGGTALSLLRPVFDSRNEKLLWVCGGDVLIVEVQSGALIGKLEHSESVVALHFAPGNEQQMITCTSRSDLYIWDLGTQTVLKYHRLPLAEVHTMVSLKHTYVLGVSDDAGKGTKLFRCQWPDNVDQTPKLFTIIETKSTENFLPSDERMIAISDTMVVWCCKRQIHGRLLTADGQAKKADTRTGTLSYTCSEKYDRLVDNDLMKFESVALHGPTDSVAAGLSTGKIYLWYNVSKAGIARPNQFIHWQKSPVMDLVFTDEGTSLLSGGGETVLVKYTLHSAGQPTRQFLARVGGGILRISLSKDNSRCALVLDDNSVQIVHTIVMNVIASAQGLIKSRLPPSIGLKRDLAGAAGDKTLGSILTNGRPGHIQFFDPVQAMHIFSLDVSGQNLPDADRYIYGEMYTWSEVVRAATAKHWLATLECRSDALKTHREELYLKFWRFQVEQNRFSLHTVVEYPHNGLVTDFDFRPSADLGLCLLTAGKDGKLKIWCLNDDEEAWQCERMLNYQRLPANAFAFSARSAVLASGFGDVIALWQNDDWSLLAAAQVYPPDANCEIKQIIWGLGSQEHMLLVGTDKAVLAWDTRSLSAVWVVAQKSTPMLAVDPASGLFVAVSGVHLFMFSSVSPEPLLTYLFPSAQDALCFVPAEVIPKHSEFNGQLSTITSRLFVMSEQRELAALMPPLSKRAKKRTRRDGSSVSGESKTPVETTPFSLMLREERMLQTTTSSEQRKAERDHAGNVELLTAPAHTLPPVDVLAPAFIRSCLIHREDPVLL